DAADRAGLRLAAAGDDSALVPVQRRRARLGARLPPEELRSSGAGDSQAPGQTPGGPEAGGTGAAALARSIRRRGVTAPRARTPGCIALYFAHAPIAHARALPPRVCRRVAGRRYFDR